MRIKLINIAGARSGDKGKHSRFAVGTNSLPRNVIVEIEAVAEIQ